MRDEDQRDWIEETLRFEQRRAKFQLFLAQLEWSELNLVAEDVKKMLDYKAKVLEGEGLNRAWLAERGMTVLPTTYSPFSKNKDVA